MVSIEQKRALGIIKKQNNQPKDEEKIIPLTKNLNQFKVAIPKKFTDILKLNKDKNKAKFIYHKEENKLTMEII